ncbi:MAG: FtsX-like permease family protein [Lentisphaeria bacterium]|nr:FtsX-like permease family protein [Lentisphaeria bacterium]
MSNPLKFALKSISYHWRQSVLAASGGALACAVLTGALIMGTSVRHTLAVAGRERLGRIEFTVGDGSRLFATDLAERLDPPLAPVLVTRGSALITPDTGEPEIDIPMIQVVGVDERFFRSFADSAGPSPRDGEVVINESLAARLGKNRPDHLSIRVPVFTALSREAPLARGGGKNTSRWRGVIAGVARPDQLGNFHLAAEQRPVPTAFVRLERLQALTQARGRANLFVGKGLTRGLERLNADLTMALQPEDYGLRFRKIAEPSRLLVTSDRVFLDPEVAEALGRLPGARRSLMYLVNRIDAERAGGKKTTPYSFVEAVGPAGPAVRVNSWLADMLGVAEGDEITTSFFVVNAGGGFDERIERLKVDDIEPVDDWFAEAALTPDFPGLTDVDRCAGWDIGLPMNEEALKDPANEAYWQSYRATPKIRVPFDMGRRLWGSRYGDTTAVHFPLTPAIEDDIRVHLRESVAPASVGLSTRDVQAEGQAAVADAMDFGALFGAMSFFVVVSALLLTGLQTALGLEKRLAEAGVLKAVGFTTGTLRRQLVIEVVVTLIPGVAAGACLAPVYAKALLWGLNGRWGGAVADSALSFACSPDDFLTGALLVGGLGTLAGIGVVWKRCGWPPVVLIRGETDPPGKNSGAEVKRRRPGNGKALTLMGLISWSIAGVTAVSAALLTPDALTAPPFFIAGALVLAGAALLLHGRLERHGAARRRPRGTFGLMVGGLSRRPTRTTLAVMLTASGCFLVFTVAGMSRDVSRNAQARNSGTGGFTFFAESAIPVFPERSADNPSGIFFPTYYADAPDGVVPLRTRSGADASCLNLNASPEPRIHGVDPGLMMKKSAFVKPGAGGAEWDKLMPDTRPGAAEERDWIPALAGDIDTAAWGLRLKAHPVKGDILRYPRNDGGWVKVKLVGRLPHRLTVFQGSILINGEDFVRNFPEEEGYRAFLFDQPAGKADVTIQALRRSYGSLGLDVETTSQRLSGFYRVEATYLKMFLSLGGMGVALGTLGLGVVVSRNLLERRGEFALMRAVGFPRQRLYLLALGEAALMLGAGLAIGTGASLLAVSPGVVSGAARPPVAMMAGVLGGLMVNGLFWVWLGARGVTRMPMLTALRSE